MTQQATFAAGCFWHVEAEFRNTPGVLGTRVGYIGGHTEQPTYKDVCGHRTGHAEAVQVDFDPQQTSYEQLLDRFWELHDPTQVNRQGPDVGDNYRSAIFAHTPEQESMAQASLARNQPRFSRPIATQISAAPKFWVAEEYHQRYFEKHGMASCRIPGQEVG
ncbi:MAG TPA: peptide-methionine (S)-S-oxide reductase MsrA [Candidatus Dormibacteraeota bacterium]|jgi:peptide-methionine (S)-S-oxide reductase|nr:peptide-methionine (S)-S-oxide reductase MsrA [Candidatus Dormibacteraeota bacterium]